jgi:hypothetical protein
MSDHIEISHLLAFVADNYKLMEQEEEHLLHCSDCRDAITGATLLHLKEDGPNADDGSPALGRRSKATG